MTHLPSPYYVQPGTSRRQWGAPVKLSPRGTLDTDHLINEVQKEKERKEYLEQWKREHAQQVSFGIRGEKLRTPEYVRYP